jgi:hypothetical protein
MKSKHLEKREVEFINDPLEDGVLYVSRRFQLAIHLCACGCREKTVTPLDDGTSGWRLTEEPNGVTLHPSIGNQNFNCRSHYWITNGEVVPC